MNIGKYRIKPGFMAFYLVGLSLVLSFLSFSPQDNFFTVTGRVIYDMRSYPDQLVQVRVTQDGKNFASFKCDGKGRFDTKVFPNHEYMFFFTMDFHATSKVLVDTRMPDEDVGDYVGGLFSFDCEIFELLEGLNLSLLNSPLVKITYNEEKKDFQYDKKYTEKMMYNLDGFRAQVAELKQRRRDVLKTEEEAKAAEKEIAAAPVDKERKVIEFESEKKQPKAVNKRGSRNIMDLMNEGNSEGEEETVAATEMEEADSIMESSEAVTLDKDVVVEEMTAEDLELEEAIDESDFIALNVIPKRVEMTEEDEADSPEQELMDATKMKVQQALEMKRVEEEAKIREEVRSFNTRAYIQREKRLVNKKIQNQRVGNLIKTVALAEQYYKEYYGLHPDMGAEVRPSIFSRTSNSTWVDKTYVTVMYPNGSVHFRKEEYLFGITYYYREDQEIDEKTYCSTVDQLTKSELTCAN